MKRDMSLMREILLATEAHPPGRGPANIQLPGFSAEQVSYRIKIMAEAAFIEAFDVSTSDDCGGGAEPQAIRRGPASARAARAGDRERSQANRRDA